MDAIHTLSLLIMLTFLNFHGSSCLDFHRNTSGVVFSGYVKYHQDDQDTSTTSYSLEDFKVMVQVMSTRFSRIATYGVGARNQDYIHNSTYYNAWNQVYSAEAVALVNKERNTGSLSILVGVWTSDKQEQTETEMRVALESIEKANNIYGNTVEGIVISNIKMNVTDIQNAINNINFLRNSTTHKLGVRMRIGTRQFCNGINITNHIHFQLFNESDFIICEITPASENFEYGGKAGFSTVGDDLLALRNKFMKLNPNVEVMGQISWSSKGPHSYQSIANLKEYWQEGDRWGHEHNFTIWMLEAFDIPGKHHQTNFESAHLGWWWLKDNSLVGSIMGYGEKIYDPPPLESTSWSPWIVLGITFGVFLVLVLITLVLILYFRVSKLQNVLTEEEIRDFMYGVSDDQPAQEGVSHMITESALKFPYDKSYEIDKDQIKFSENVLLGSGAFGCVYKALIDGDEKKEVALKTIKKDCPTTALKGLLSEIKILTYLGKHPNIVSIIGAYTSELKSGIVYVATELCTLGSLESILRRETANSTDNRYANAPQNATTFIAFTIKDMMRWSHEIACGMEYLGTRHVVHADLATRNVLLSSDRTAKITDFGLSRKLYDYTNYVKQQQEPLPWRWMSIEALKRLEFSSMSDVWSYGVTLWEIYSKGDLPYPGLSWNLDFVNDLSNGLRMKSPPNTSPEVYKIMEDCWHLDPRQRPTFTELKIITGKMLETIGQVVSKFAPNE